MGISDALELLDVGGPRLSVAPLHTPDELFIYNALYEPYHIYRVEVTNTFFVDGLAGCCNGFL
jgi:hypothetical protein